MHRLRPRPGHPEALPEGLCRPSHHSEAAEPPPGITEVPADDRDIQTHIATVRDLLKAP
ncbi:hypothetical protein ACFYUH_32900 [Streptomyces fimicarius]|uniref:hypothetical protein n=1 Tax=Streptomyces griseus TaxID=1911 RepID=UPI0036828121